MNKYRKKPVEIEAVQFNGENDGEILEWVGSNISCYQLYNLPKFLEIRTIEGTMEANATDWIIKGIEGEFYPCKDSIFRATYEEVT